jgi:hypothetical protein
MAPSGLAQRYLAAIQNNDKEPWQSSSLQLSSSSESTYVLDNEGTSGTADDELCYFQTRNGSNSPSRLRIRDSSSCHSRDSVSSEEGLLEPMVLDEYRQTQNKWRNFRNAMKQKAAIATAAEEEENGETDPTTRNDNDEAISDAYPPTEVINNISIQWKQIELNKWKNNMSSSTSPTLAKLKQGSTNDRGWIRNDKTQVTTTSITLAAKADLNAENDSMDNKTIPQHKVHDETNHDLSASSTSQAVSSPWAVKLRPVKNTKSKLTTADHHEDRTLNNEKDIHLTCDAETEDITEVGHLGKWNSWNKSKHSKSTNGVYSNTSDSSWIKMDRNEMNTSCSRVSVPQSPKKLEQKESSLISNPSSSFAAAPTSPLLNCRSPGALSKNLRQSTSWIKSSSVEVESSPQLLQPVIVDTLNRTHDPVRTVPCTKSSKLPEKSVGRRSLSLNSVRTNSTHTIARQTPNVDATKQSLSDVEVQKLSFHSENNLKTVSEAGIPTASVRNIRSLFESKSIKDDRPPRKETLSNGKKTQVSSKNNRTLDEKTDNVQTKTNQENSVNRDKDVIQHFAPKTLYLIKTKLMPHNRDMVDHKHSSMSTVDQSSHIPQRNGSLETKVNDYSPSRKASGVMSLKSKFESSPSSKIVSPKSYTRRTQRVTEYEDEIHQVPTDETDGSKYNPQKSYSANIETDEARNVNQVFAFEKLRSKFNGSSTAMEHSSTNMKLSNTFSGGESTFNSLCVENQASDDQEVNSIPKVRPIPKKANSDIGKQSAFTAYQQRSHVTPAASETLIANDIPWDSKTPNDIPWNDRELQDDKVDSYMHDISMLTDKRVIDMSYGIEYLDCSLDDDDGDGVTLSPHPSDVSSLSIPSCIQSLDAVTSDDDTGAIESITEKQSSVLGPSEASSSQMSESAKPLIYSALGTMGRKFPIKSSSDTSQSFSVQYTGLLNALPPSIDNPSQVEQSERHVTENMFFQESKDQKSRESMDINNQFEDELRVHPGQEWKNDLFAIDSVKSYTSGDDIRWAEFPDTNFVGFHGSNATLSSENHSGSFGVASRKTTADSSSKGSRSTSSPNPGHRKTISSERIKTPTLPVVRECNVESSVIKHGSSSSTDLENTISMETGKDSADDRVSTYRRFNIQKVRAFQQFRRSKSYNN